MNASLRYLPVPLLLVAVCAGAQNHDPAPAAAGATVQAQDRQSEADARRAMIEARNAQYVAAVERAALRRGVELHWVNPPPVDRARAYADTFQTR